MASPCVPSPVSGIRTPRLPLLPLWEKGVGGMRGNSARECRTSLISPKHSTLESAPPGCAGVPPACSSTKVRTTWVRERPARTQQHKGTHRLGARAPRLHAAAQRYAPPGCVGVPPAHSSTKVRTAWVRGRPARTQCYDLLSFQASGHPPPLLPSRKKGVGGMKGKGASSAPMASPPRHTAATHSQHAE